MCNFGVNGLVKFVFVLLPILLITEDGLGLAACFLWVGMMDDLGMYIFLAGTTLGCCGGCDGCEMGQCLENSRACMLCLVHWYW